MSIPLIIALHNLRSHETLRCLTLQGLLVAAKYIHLLKDDILIAQDANDNVRLLEEGTGAPPRLPVSVGELISGTLGLDYDDMAQFWEILGEILWEPMVDDIPCNGTDFLAFKHHGWKQGLTAFPLFPPSQFCTNVRCDYRQPLKRQIHKFGVIYTRANGAQLGHHVHLYCHRCNTSYHNNYSIQDDKRTYYPGVPEYLQVAQHHFVEKELAVMWRQATCLGWFSAGNHASLFEEAMQHKNEDLLTFDNSDIQVNFTPSLSAEHVWDTFTILSLLEDGMQQGELLVVPASGDQSQRFVEAMSRRNERIILYGQPDAVEHICDKCARFFEMPDGEIRYSQAAVSDGLSMGRPCCGEFRCSIPLASTRDRFCPTHSHLNDVCAVKGCNSPVDARTVVDKATGKSKAVKRKTCTLPLHRAIEDKAEERGTACFLLRDRFQHARAVYGSKKGGPGTSSAMELPPEVGISIPEEVETFVVTGPDSVAILSQPNPGTVGVENEAVSESPSTTDDAQMLVDPDTGTNGEASSPMLVDAPQLAGTQPRGTLPVPQNDCPSKSKGNRTFKAQLSRTRSHNEQTVLRPCGITMSRATMFGVEAVSNHLVMQKNTFSVPGSRKPDHSFYDTNCLAAQQAESDPWFNDVGMCVDVWHFRNKHAVTHKYCQLHCNPASYPELMDEHGNWIFNTSIAEQTNAWLGGFFSICREMTATRYDFFLDEMIRLRNKAVLVCLQKAGANPRVYCNI
ncbi:hypothetical protein NMY22_g10758 [Coprinellus aureogranulatus]|nr:hypothetical protein NMY22_g10758 [Coprinellus aureogranulatus]